MIRHNPGVDITVISDGNHIESVCSLLNRLAVTGISTEVYQIEAGESITEKQIDRLLQKTGAGLLLGSLMSAFETSELLNKSNYSVTIHKHLAGNEVYEKLKEVYRSKLRLNRSWKENVHLVDEEWETN